MKITTPKSFIYMMIKKQFENKIPEGEYELNMEEVLNSCTRYFILNTKANRRAYAESLVEYYFYIFSMDYGTSDTLGEIETLITKNLKSDDLYYMSPKEGFSDLAIVKIEADGVVICFKIWSEHVSTMSMFLKKFFKSNYDIGTLDDYDNGFTSLIK